MAKNRQEVGLTPQQRLFLELTVRHARKVRVIRLPVKLAVLRMERGIVKQLRKGSRWRASGEE